MTETPMVERESLDEIAAALAAFQAEMPTVKKGKTADTGTYRYKYADLSDIVEAVGPVLARHGLAFTCSPGRDGLTAMLLHTSGQRLTGILPITGATPQQVGSSLTYGRRYLFGCLTGVVTDDDDDGAAASKPQPRKRPEPRPPVAPPLATPENPAPDGSIDVPLPEPVDKPESIPEPMRKAFHAGMAKALPPGLERPDRIAILSAIIGRVVESSNDLTRNEISRALRFCDAAQTGRAGVVRRDGQWAAVAYDEPPEQAEP